MHLKWEITNKCTLKCSYCSNSASNNILSCDSKISWKDVLDYFGSDLHSVDFLGGEPLLYNELSQVVDECTQRGIRTTVVTNGQQASEIGVKLLISGIDSITVSIEGLRETHDEIRGAGTWDKAISFLSDLVIYCRTQNIEGRLRVNCVVTRKNYKEIVALIEICREMNIEIQITHIVEKGKAVENKKILALDNMEYLDFYNSVGSYMAKSRYEKIILVNATACIKEYLNYKFDLRLQYEFTSCSANSSSFALDVGGKLYGCNLLKNETDCNTKIGERDFFSMLRKQSRKIEFVEEQEQLTCLECRFRDDCHPCPYSSNSNMPELCLLFTESLESEILESKRKFFDKKSNIRIGSKYEIAHVSSGEIIEYTKEGIAIYDSLKKGMSKSEEIAKKLSMDKIDVEYFLFTEVLKNHIICKVG